MNWSGDVITTIPIQFCFFSPILTHRFINRAINYLPHFAPNNFHRPLNRETGHAPDFPTRCSPVFLPRFSQTSTYGVPPVIVDHPRQVGTSTANGLKTGYFPPSQRSMPRVSSEFIQQNFTVFFPPNLVRSRLKRIFCIA